MTIKAKQKADKAALVVRFRSTAEYRRLQRAAAKEQKPLQDSARCYPNVSKFLRDAANERADRVLGSKTQVV